MYTMSSAAAAALRSLRMIEVGFAEQVFRLFVYGFVKVGDETGTQERVGGFVRVLDGIWAVACERSGHGGFIMSLRTLRYSCQQGIG